jgi:sugar-specific transcriptional regulator TrmB/DNA-binding CsgD family transcriptional regulator
VRSSGAPRPVDEVGEALLEALGFSPVEEQVYDLLVARGRMTLAEVIAEGDVKPKRQMEALDRLVGTGLVRRLASPVQEFVVAPPEYAIEVLIAERLSALQAVRENAAELAARVRRVTQETDPTELIEVVSGEGSVRQLFLQVIRSAHEEIAVFDRPPYASNVDEAMSAEAERLRTGGLRLRTVFDRSLLDEPDHVRRILQGVEAGEEARIGRVPLKLAVIDRESAMLPLLQTEGRLPEAVVIVRRSVLLDSLVALFESVWEHAVEVRPTSEDDLASSGTPEGELRQLAHLLAAGLTDVAIARHLGLSQRTVRRRVKDLLAELGVDSRFLAGVRAAQRGWLGTSSGEGSPEGV